MYEYFLRAFVGGSSGFWKRQTKKQIDQNFKDKFLHEDNVRLSCFQEALGFTKKYQ